MLKIDKYVVFFIILISWKDELLLLFIGCLYVFINCKIRYCFLLEVNIYFVIGYSFKLYGDNLGLYFIINGKVILKKGCCVFNV